MSFNVIVVREFWEKEASAEIFRVLIAPEKCLKILNIPMLKSL